ncbi:hypothetical protein PR048_024363, partial [Dryococelus australis]
MHCETMHFYLPNITNPLPNVALPPAILQHIEHLNLADPTISIPPLSSLWQNNGACGHNRYLWVLFCQWGQSNWCEICNRICRWLVWLAEVLGEPW